MTQATGGVRRILSHSAVYEAWSRAVGGERARSRFASTHIRAQNGARVLDLGCGTGELLNHLPSDVRYLGIDISEDYVARASRRRGERASFRVGDATAIDKSLGQFDLVIAFGVLHHIDDGGVASLFDDAADVLAASGRVVTIDPVFAPDQSRAARALMMRDRGQHIRTSEEYLALARDAFATVAATIYHDLLWIPYSHCVLECERPLQGVAA